MKCLTSWEIQVRNRKTFISFTILLFNLVFILTKILCAYKEANCSTWLVMKNNGHFPLPPAPNTLFILFFNSVSLNNMLILLLLSLALGIICYVYYLLYLPGFVEMICLHYNQYITFIPSLDI